MAIAAGDHPVAAAFGYQLGHRRVVIGRPIGRALLMLIAERGIVTLEPGTVTTSSGSGASAFAG